MVRNLSKVTAAAIFAIGFAAGSAQALTLSATDCLVGSVSGALACEGVYEGNNSNQDLNGLFGIADWGTEEKIDASSGSETFAGTTLTVNADLTWSLTNVGAYDSLMFVTKGGNSFSAFLMDTSVLSGTYDLQSMIQVNGQRGAGLSHWSIYTSGDGSPAPVPVPAAGLLMLLGLGGLGAMRRRKTA